MLLRPDASDASFSAFCMLSESSTESVGASVAVALVGPAVGAELVGSLEGSDVTTTRVGLEVSSGGVVPSTVGEPVISGREFEVGS